MNAQGESSGSTDIESCFSASLRTTSDSSNRFDSKNQRADTLRSPVVTIVQVHAEI